jgi:transposase
LPAAEEREMEPLDDVFKTPCAGIDVHKRELSVCVDWWGADGKLKREVRNYDTKRKSVRAMGVWFKELGVTHAALESTANYWRPVFDQLETICVVVLLNPYFVKQMPGRKTDVADCIWIATLLRKGLLRASFIPPREIRDLRDLTRLRTVRIEHAVKVGNELRQCLEKAHIKLDSVVSDLLGVSGRAMIRAMIEGETNPEVLANLAQRRMRGKIPELRAALDGRLNDHYRFLMRQHWDLLETLEKQVGKLEQQIEQRVIPFDWAVRLLMTAPGIKKIAAATILAEIGDNMDCFETARHLTSWAGVCPGNNRSAGRSRSGRNPRGNRFIKGILVQVALAASRTKQAYAHALYQRIARHRGKKRALLALANSLLQAIWYMLKHRQEYKELGVNYFKEQNKEQLTQALVKRLERLGHQVTLRQVA